MGPPRHPSGGGQVAERPRGQVVHAASLAQPGVGLPLARGPGVLRRRVATGEDVMAPVCVFDVNETLLELADRLLA
jgi:hypothetical protein